MAGLATYSERYRTAYTRGGRNRAHIEASASTAKPYSEATKGFQCQPNELGNGVAAHPSTGGTT